MEFKKIGVSEYACRCPYPGHEDKNPGFNVSTFLVKGWGLFKKQERWQLLYSLQMLLKTL